jgi:glycosyltransferase involved in cell wall biosynthesis
VLDGLRHAVRRQLPFIRTKVRKLGYHLRSASLAPPGPARGRVLISYLADPFLRRGVDRSHTHFAESVAIVDVYRDLGYHVDVIDYRNRLWRPRHDYDLVVDARRNLERLGPTLGTGCVKILHADTSHLLFQNAAEADRLLEIQQRRGVTLRPRRYELPNLAVEHADAAVVIGNDLTLSTYAYAATPLHRINVLSGATFERSDGKDLDVVRRRWLWLGSGGFALKGLDIVLEAFAAAPDLELVVCGPIDGEPDFREAFRRELYETENITTVGWVDVTSPAFRQVVEGCVGAVYTSASEGQSGAVATSLSAGLIPVVSERSGFDIDADVGRLLPDPTPHALLDAVREVSDLPTGQLAALSENARSQAERDHSAGAYRRRYRELALQLLGGPG